MLEQASNFPCPHCKEIISDRATECRFCGAPVDPGVARLVAENQRKVNRAFSDSGYIRNAALLMWGLLLVSFIPFIPGVGMGFLMAGGVVTFMLIRWFVMYGEVKTSDPDYQKARQSVYLSIVLLAAAIPVLFLVKPLLLSRIF
jgi:hypothetical protein